MRSEGKDNVRLGLAGLELDRFPASLESGLVKLTRLEPMRGCRLGFGLLVPGCHGKRTCTRSCNSKLTLSHEMEQRVGLEPMRGRSPLLPGCTAVHSADDASVSVAAAYS